MKNSYYLNHLSCAQCLFTYVQETGYFYQLIDGQQLAHIEVNTVVATIKNIGSGMVDNIDSIFHASEYLVSPLNTPNKFIRGEYFLTQQQEEFKRSILGVIRDKSSKLIAIEGNPGTGKTLLLYDIAKTLCQYKKCCIVHCGILSDGHIYLNKHIPGLRIISAKDFQMYSIIPNAYDVLLFDEFHRIHEKGYEKMLNALDESDIAVIVSFDSGQILSFAELRRDTVSKIKGRNQIVNFTLSKKIRTNREIAAFILGLFDQSKINHNFDYVNVKILYSSRREITQFMINQYTSMGYYYINHTPSSYNNGS